LVTISYINVQKSTDFKPQEMKERKKERILIERMKERKKERKKRRKKEERKKEERKKERKIPANCRVDQLLVYNNPNFFKIKASPIFLL
jgi:hypothetical protein